MTNAGNVEVFLDGMYKKGKITITDNLPCLWGDGDVCIITPCQLEPEQPKGKDKYAPYDALIMPLNASQLENAYLRVMVDGVTYKYQLKKSFEGDMPGGYRYTFNVNVNATDLDVKAQEVVWWENDKNDSGLYELNQILIV